MSGFSITEKTKIFKITYKKQATNDMVEYDSEYIGNQTATLRYKNEKIGFSLTIKPKLLESPVIAYKNGILDWDDISFASEYIININGLDYTTTVSQFNLENLNILEGDVSIKVKSNSNHSGYIDSDYSNTITLKKLDYTKNIYYEDGKMKWDAVQDVTSYNIWVNGSRYVSNTNECDVSAFGEGENKVQVESIGGPMTISSFSDEFIFTKYSAVDNIRYVNERLSWDSDNIGCEYEVIVDGEKYFTQNNYYDILLTVDVAHKVKIKSLSKQPNCFDSEYSDEVEIIYPQLETPQVIIKLGSYANTYTAQILPVDNANSYTCIINIYKEGEVKLTSTYTVSDILSKEIVVDEITLKIEVTVIAKDTKGVYHESEAVTVIRELK